VSDLKIRLLVNMRFSLEALRDDEQGWP